MRTEFWLGNLKRKDYSVLHVGIILKLILVLQYVKVWTPFGLIIRPEESCRMWCV